MLIHAPVLTATKRFIMGLCSSGSLSVGDAVRVTGQSVNQVYPVSKVDITDTTKMPSVGVVTSVLSPTSVTLQIAGEVHDVLTGMTFGTSVFVGSSGQTTQTKPSKPSTGYRYIQMIGHPIDTNVFLLNFQPTIKILP